MSLAFVRGIHRWPVNSPHKGPVTQNMFPFDDVITLRKRGVNPDFASRYSWNSSFCLINRVIYLRNSANTAENWWKICYKQDSNMIDNMHDIFKTGVDLELWPWAWVRSSIKPIYPWYCIFKANTYEKLRRKIRSNIFPEITHYRGKGFVHWICSV